MTVKRIVANMLTAEPGRAKSFYGGIFDMHPVMDHGWIQTYAAGGDPAGAQLSFAGEGGSGAPIDRDAHHRAVEFWEANANWR